MARSRTGSSRTAWVRPRPISRCSRRTIRRATPSCWTGVRASSVAYGCNTPPTSRVWASPTTRCSSSTSTAWAHTARTSSRRKDTAMKSIFRTVCALLWLLAQPAPAALNILACEPEWGALAKELGGDKVNIYVAATALQDPHRIEARPSLIARARSADLVVCTGAELEVGWLPLLQTQSGNPKIQVGQP